MTAQAQLAAPAPMPHVPPEPPATAVAKTPSPYLVSASYDLGYFIFSPVLALLLTIVLARAPGLFEQETWLGTGKTWAAVFLAIWINAHLIAVVFRSHANAEIFTRFRTRFTWVPLCLFTAFMLSNWLMTTGAVLGVLWDVYHSSMQNFGFSRIYDAKAGNPPTRGRSLDMLFNHVVYIGPIFLGANLAPTLAVINSYSTLGWNVPSQLFQWVGSVQHQVARAVLIGGGAYVVFYVLAYARLLRQGHRLSKQKVMLLLSTASISILAWGYLPPFQAFFIANFFHGLQYFAIVWATEKKTIQQVFAKVQLPKLMGVALAGFLFFVFAMGTAHTVFDVPRLRVGFAFFTLVSLMHFWYDGFIWSVRRAEVKVGA